MAKVGGLILVFTTLIRHSLSICSGCGEHLMKTLLARECADLALTR